MYKCPTPSTPNPKPISIVDRDDVFIYGFTNIWRTTRSGRDGLGWRTTTDEYLVFLRALLRLLQQDSYTTVSDCATIFSLRTATLPIVASIVQILFANTRSSTFSSSPLPISQVVVSHIHPTYLYFVALTPYERAFSGLRIADRG
ncbi:hypothetical protein B0H14DRAFT_3854738 [Mycena olivaceomarginata]|nr:hypothetical protein B0H14DRAFT_3854738 [Mycena olivaceomarginata]